jgi:ABC-2 type transport system ATP-binding protein
MLEIQHLYKKFGGKVALKNVSFHVKQGEIYGLLGHNGAGKSTTLGIILGMIAADQGDVFIDEISVTNHRSKALKKVGAIFEAPSFYDYMSGWDNLKLLVSYSCKFNEKETRAVVESVNLSDRIHSKVRTYSHGMRQRLALAQSLLPEPEILLLDEPTDGLDPEGIKWFREFILDLRKKRGMTVLFNSHLLGEVEQMCDRIAIVQGGERVFEGELSNLDEGNIFYEIDSEPWTTVLSICQELDCIVRDRTIQLPHDLDPAILCKKLVTSGVNINAFSPRKRSLEDLYMEIREQGGRETHD